MTKVTWVKKKTKHEVTRIQKVPIGNQLKTALASKVEALNQTKFGSDDTITQLPAKSRNPSTYKVNFSWAI